MPVHKRGDRWHYAFCIRGVRYRGALPEARTKFEAEKAETKIRQEVYEGRYGRPTGEKDFGRFVEEVYKPWARENKRSFDNNEKYKLPMICSVLTGPRGHLLPLVVIAIGTGMRRGDLFKLKWEKIDFQRGLIYVPNSKTGRDYSVPMNE